MALRPVQDGEQGQALPVRPFRPDHSWVTVAHEEERPVRLDGDPYEGLLGFTAVLWRGPDDADDDLAGEEIPEDKREKLAELHFTRINFGDYFGDAGVKYDFADAISGDLLVVAEALFDDEGMPRDELDAVGIGNDVP